MAKNIVICCDGTGNEYGDENSNVVQLYRTLIIDGKRQVGYYHPGVGTEGSPTSTNKISAAISVIGGLAFGTGILDNISDAYRYLMNVYEDGDDVYLFGLSRGAYTARALAGVLHMFGLLCPGNEGLIPYVVRMYARRTRKADGMTHTFEVAAGFKATFCRPCPLHLVGLWDTVSSVGWIWDPLKLPYTARNPDMAHGRHAVSIDERRCYFCDNLWGAPFPAQDIKQVWFSGVHSDVGGSYPSAQSGLSQITLQWMLCEAVSLGLLVNPEQANGILGRVPGSQESRPIPLSRNTTRSPSHGGSSKYFRTPTTMPRPKRKSGAFRWELRASSHPARPSTKVSGRNSQQTQPTVRKTCRLIGRRIPSGRAAPHLTTLAISLKKGTNSTLQTNPYSAAQPPAQS